jgi:hypothetical protein
MTSTEQQTAIDAAIIDSATNPKTIVTEGLTVTRQSIDEIIKADKHLAKRNVAGFGLRCGKAGTAGGAL